MSESKPPLYTNRLIREKSPYLLQHAHNPIDWYPWSEEAFQLAVEQDKPIFLSIGYATCHWCHMMEQESFQNLEVAQLMNDTFINIKVDREEKPDVDNLYLEFAQAMMSGTAGWPLNLILTPERLPFFASTYLPLDAAHGMMGMKQLVSRIQQIWRDPEEQQNVIEQAGKIVDIFANNAPQSSSEMPSRDQVKQAAELLFKNADPIFGGVKGAPKFPVSLQAMFLLRQALFTSDSRALFYVDRSLDMMYRGGIYDHLGGGFSRYSVDERWLVPHFEKMLYDNALLARTYLESWQYTRQPLNQEIVHSILSYVSREMATPEGGFYSAEDADTEEGEGFFYSWSWEEVQDLLGGDASLFCEYYGVVQNGSFKGRNLLHIPHKLEEFAAKRRLDPNQLNQIIRGLTSKLWDARNKRSHPQKDDQVITSWNGLMITSFAEAGRVLEHPPYLEIAKKGAEFIRENLWDGEKLYRRWRAGEAKFDGYLDDYAFLIQGLISLFEADLGSEWLEFALTLTHVLNSEFKSPEGGYYLTNGKDENLILRRIEFYDGAEPSGNAVQAENLLRLYQITGIEDFQREVEEIMKAAKEHIDLYPPGTCYHLMALQRYYDEKAPTFVVSLNDQEEHREKIAQLLCKSFIPHKSIIWRRESDEQLRDLAPFSRDRPCVQGQTTLYVCYPQRCEEPIVDLDKMKQLIESI